MRWMIGNVPMKRNEKWFGKLPRGVRRKFENNNINQMKASTKANTTGRYAVNPEAALVVSVSFAPLVGVGALVLPPPLVQTTGPNKSSRASFVPPSHPEGAATTFEKL